MTKDILDALQALAEKATPGPWQRSARPAGPFWHISSNHTVNGKPCLSGRQAIASVHAESKKGASAYAAMFEANAAFIAAANPQTILSLIARIRELEGDTGKSAEADDADRLFVLLAEIRAACGDNGKRMQDELVEYIAGLARSANRWQLACAYEDNAGLLYCAVINNAGDMAAINAEFDADAIDTPQVSPQAEAQSPQAEDRNWQLREGDPFKSEGAG